MAAVADVLSQNGVLRAAEVIELAAAAQLAITVAATLLEKESGGGRNVWGHDAVPTGGNYVKGAVVTKEAYAKYKAARAQHGSQGVGPTQLTWHEFQDEADRRGGCWDWRTNCAVGFEILAKQIKARGTRDGFRAYNGSGDAAERYANDAMAKLKRWQDRLGETSPPSPVEDDMAKLYRRPAPDQSVWRTDGITRSRVPSPDVVKYWERAGMQWLSPKENTSIVQDDVHNSFVDVTP